VCVRACMLCVCVRACMCVYVCVRVCVCVWLQQVLQQRCCSRAPMQARLPPSPSLCCGMRSSSSSSDVESPNQEYRSDDLFHALTEACVQRW